MIELSQQQKEIVNSPIDKSIQVLASAGSGKTRVLTERIRYILDQTKKDSILAFTFTNKAADEMQDRLSDSDEASERAWVTTIHAAAQRVIEQYGHTIGLPDELHIYERDQDRMEVFVQSLRDDDTDIDEYLNISDSKELTNRKKVLQEYMDGFSMIKKKLLSESDVEREYPNLSDLWKIFNDYQNALLNSGGIDFDDILVYAHQLLLTHDWIANVYRAKFKHICVDEAQDLNKAQYEFIKALCGDKVKSILMVGDPNQMIYGFNGSSAKFLCENFVSDFASLKFSLKNNYRSSKKVIHVANKLKEGSQSENLFAIDGECKIQSFPNEKSEALGIISKIKEFISMKTHADIEGNISLKQMVIIGRNRFVFKKLEDELEKAEIPYVMRKGERSTAPTSLFCKVLDYSIRLKINSKDWVNGKKLCSLLDQPIPDQWAPENLFQTWEQGVRSSNPLISKLLNEVNAIDTEEPNIRKFVRTFKQELTGLVKSKEADPDEVERSLEELEDFKQAWTRFKRKGLGNSLQAFRNAMSLGQLAEDFNPGGLTLSTVHTMKGLEKDIVFLMGMCEGIFPDYRAKTAKEIMEEQNNAFVAVTRAKRWLYISYPESRVMPWGDSKFQRASRFLRKIEK